MASQFSIKLSVSAVDLIKSIKQTIDDINTGDKLKNKPLNISVSAAKLRESIRNAISEINASGKLSNTPVRLKVKLDVDEAVKNLQKQLSTLNLKTGGTSANSTALSQSINATTNAIKTEGAAVQAVNNLLREQQTLFLKSGDIKRVQTFGTTGNTITNTFLNGNQTTQTTTTDYARQQREADRAYAAYQKLDSIVNKLQADFSDLNSTKPIRDQAHIDEINVALTETRNKIKLVETASIESFARVKSDAESAVESLKLFIKTRQNEEYAASQLRAKDVPTVKAIQTNYFDELKAKINSSRVSLSELTNDLNVLQMLLRNITDRNSLTAYLNQLSITEAKFDSLKAKARETSDFSKQIAADLKKLNSLTNGTIFKHSEDNANVVRLREQINSLIERYQALRSASSPNATPEQMAGNIEMLRELQTELQALTQSTAAVRENLRNTNAAVRENLRNTKIDDNLLVKIQRLNAQISEFVRKNGKAMEVINPITGNTFGADVNNIQGSLSAIQTFETFDKINGQFQILRSNIKAIGVEGSTMLSELGGKLSKFVKWFGVTYVFTKARMYFNKLFTTVYELDTALIDLEKTFNGTTEELNDFYFEANKLAKQMGVTTAEIIKQGAAWSRLGYSSNETMQKMAEMSAMFAAISPDMDTETAQNGLVSIMKAFKINPEDTLDGILSKVNIIGNTAATSNGEIVEMLQKSSAAMKEANNTLEQTIALETAAVEITRDAPGVGTAFKTISARLRSLDEETLQVTGDIEELTGKFANATKTANNPNGISLFADANKNAYKSTYQIFRELAEIWDDLTDRQTAELGEILGGKRQLQVVSAAIENFDAAEKALDNMANSAGSAEAEMNTIRQSAAYALNEFKETFTSLAQNSVSRGELKALINAGTALLELLNGLVKTFGGLPVAIGAASAAITAFKKKGEGLLGYNSKGNFTFWGAETKNGFKSWYNEKTAPTGQKAQIKNQIAAVKEFDNAIKTNSMNLRTYNAVMQSSNDKVKRYGRAVMQGADQSKAFNTVNKQLKKELKQVGENSRVAADGTKQLSAGMKALNIASSMIVSMGISLAISKVIELISTSVNWADTYSQKADDAADKTKSITSQIESVNEELADTKLKIDKLNKLEKPTIIQQEELDKLIETNNELERLQKSLQAQQKDAANEAADATVEWWKTIYYGGIGEGYKDPGDWFLHFFPRLWSGTKKDIEKESYNSFLNAIVEYKELQDEIAEKQKEMSESTDESYIIKLQDQISDLEDKLRDAESIAEHNYASWTAKLGTLNLDIPEQKEIYDKMNELIYYWEYFSGKVKKELKDIVDDPNYAVVKQHLIDLWKQGKLTEEEFSKITDETVSGFEAFKQALADNGYTDFAEILRAIITYFEDTAENADNAAKAVKTFADMLEAVQDKIDGFLSKQEKLVKAFKEIELGGKLSANEVYELVKEMPELAKYLTETADGWEISSKNFDKASKDNIEAEKQELQSRIDTIRSYLETLGMAKTLGNQVKYSKDDPLLQAEYENALKKARGLYGALDISSDDEIGKAFDDLSEELNGLLFLMDLVDKTFNRHEEAVNGLKERYEEVKSEISDYNKQIQSIDSAIKSLNGDTLLSYDELNELLEIDPDLKYDKKENGYSISIDALEELREKSYETRNARIADIKAVVQAEIEAANTTKAEYQKEIEEIGKMGVTATALEALGEVTKNLDGVNGQLDYLYDLLKKLDGLEQDITYDAEADKSLSDKLQNEIDYYKTILDAVSAVKDKYTEVLDNEINALEDSKDALKDANDERQRELDLIEARNNLENAKKRKVYVYTEGEGFKQVQDKAAVKEAEEKYRDAITDIQIAEIDKAIEESEKQKETLEQSVKDLLELEQNIQDSMAISQAMQALGLSDPSQLLNLPDDVKETIINGLADATIQKDIEDNKENVEHIAVTLDNVLANLGSNKTMADLSPDILDNVKQAAYNNAVQGFAEAAKDMAENMINNITNVNNPTINQTNSIVINDATDPEKVGQAVGDYIKDMLTQYNNSLK